MLDEGSLTAHLVAASGGKFFVQVISQRWGRARLDEARLLKIGPRQICLLREVFLVCRGEPWVYARSVLPVNSLQGPLRHLRRFGNAPLGQLLFNDPGIQRQPFELAQVPAKQIPRVPGGAAIEDAGTGCPGRRSRFVLKGKSLMVSEIFLPAFWEAMANMAPGSSLHSGGRTRNPPRAMQRLRSR